MARFTRWADPAAESLLLGSVELQEPLALMGRFGPLVRYAGSADERAAADAVAARLARWEIPFVRHDPYLYVSVPRQGELRVITPAYARSLRCQVPAYAGVTGDTAVEGDLVHLPGAPGPAARGKVVLTPGYPDAGRLQALAEQGALAVLFMQPGERIQPGSVSRLWGAPDLEGAGQRACLPAASVSGPDGLALLEALGRGPVTIRLKTDVEQGWARCPVLVAELRGTEEPELFVLLHAGLDAWPDRGPAGVAGAGAAGAAGAGALLEVARVLGLHRARLRRTVRLAWWSGEAQGAHGGAVWYADQHALDLLEHGIAHLACPAGEGAPHHSGVPLHPALEEMALGALRDATGQPAAGGRPVRDAFMNLGLPGGFGRLPPPPAGAAAPAPGPGELGAAIRTCLLAAFRLANAPVHPLDYRPLAAEMLRLLRGWQGLAGARLDLGPAVAEAEALAAELGPFYDRIEELAAAGLPAAQTARANAVLRGIGRAVNPVYWVRGDRYRPDPERELVPLPDLAPAAGLAGVPEGSDAERVLLTHLARGRNRVAGALRQARALIRAG